jgi:hypothetical protein
VGISSFRKYHGCVPCGEDYFLNLFFFTINLIEKNRNFIIFFLLFGSPWEHGKKFRCGGDRGQISGLGRRVGMDPLLWSAPLTSL